MEIGAADFKILPGLFCYRVDRHRVLVGGALTDGGSVVEWARQMLNIKESGEFDECMHKVSMLLDARYIQSASEDASFARTLTVVPFLSGERSTGFRGGATGAILGMTRDTTPAHVLLGCIEGVTLRMNAIIALIRQATEGDRKQRLIASGKALEVNELWRQMIADCSGLVCRFRYGNIGGNKSRSSVLGCGIIGILKGNINSGFARAIHNVGRVDTGSKRSCILEAGDYISGSFD
jgi:gluconokinase